MMKRISAIISCILLLITVAAGCGANGTDTKTIKIGIAMPNLGEGNQNLRGTYRKYAETLKGVELVFTDAKDDAGQQITDVENLISQNCDVIIIRAVDGETIGAACDAVVNANIPLVIDEIPVATTNYSVYILGDQINHGRLFGEYLQGLLDKGDMKEVNIGYIAGTSDADMLKRMTGISETCPSAKFVADSEEGYALADNWSAAEAQNIVENWISSGLINDMNVIACMNDALADAAITALGDDYPDMIVLGVDGKMIGRQNIQIGKMKATTSQNNTLFVKKMLDTCVNLANGAEIKFDDPENKILDPLNITLLTVDTLSAPK